MVLASDWRYGGRGLVPLTVAKQSSFKADFPSCMAGKNLKRLITSTTNSNIYAT